MRILPLALALALSAACTTTPVRHHASAATRPSVVSSPFAPPSAASTTIPPLLDPHDVYAADRPGLLSPEARLARALVYVPDSEDETVTVIDQRSRQVVQVVHTGRLPQHVTPSYDMKTLYVDNDLGDS